MSEIREKIKDILYKTKVDVYVPDIADEILSLFEDLDDMESLFRANIMRHWDRDRIEKFAKHLLGDNCQSCLLPDISMIEHVGKCKVGKDSPYDQEKEIIEKTRPATLDECIEVLYNYIRYKDPGIDFFKELPSGGILRIKEG